MIKTVITCITLIGSLTVATANDNGKAGRTSRLGEGCGDCHGITASPATSVHIEGIAGASISMAPGATREFTIVVAHPSQSVAGIDVAVRTTSDEGTNAGTLAPISGVQRKGQTGELTHLSPVNMISGVATFTFTWTAPMSAGSYYIQAIGNACNGDGAESADDQWSWMTPVEIQVGVTDVHAEWQDQELLIGHTTMTINDMNGNIVQQCEFDVASASHRLPPPAPHLPPGVYGLIIINEGHVKRTTILVD